MNITLIKYEEIDYEKYDACLDVANAPIYPYSWYLDIVTKKSWDVLILGDYETVMPLPYGRNRKTFFLKRIVQPSFCQQLGVFSKHELTEGEFTQFYSFFITLNPYSYQFNCKNLYDAKNDRRLDYKVNCVLNLNKPYQKIYQSYHASKQRRLRKLQSKDWVINESSDIHSFVLFKIVNKNNEQSKRQLKKLQSVISILHKLGHGKVYQVVHGKTTLAMVFLVSFKKRLYYMTAVSSAQGKKDTAMLYLLDKLFEKYSNQDYVFDFEGSSILGIKRFFMELGAEQTFYMHYKNDN